MTIQPLKNRVHLKRVPHETMSAGGIALLAPSDKDENTGYAIVCGLGPDVDPDIGLTVGAKVFIGNWNGMDIAMKIGEEDVCAINDVDILAVCEE